MSDGIAAAIVLGLLAFLAVALPCAEHAEKTRIAERDAHRH